MLAFVHIEKAAGTTMNLILHRSFGLRHCDVQSWHHRRGLFTASDYRRLRWLYPGLMSVAGHYVQPYSDLESARPDTRYYTILREPLMRCASHYQYQVQHMNIEAGFEEWIANPEFRDFQTRKLVGSDDLDAAIRVLTEKLLFVGLVERFDESLVMLRRKAGIRRFDIRYTRERVAENNTIKRRILDDPDSYKLLVEANRVDAELYRFVAEELMDRQRREYGSTLDSDLASFQEAKAPPSRQLTVAAVGVRHAWVYEPALRYYRNRLAFQRENTAQLRSVS
ncbi:MAG: sulfotransferase family 2 domain-containing protein [Phycisphaerales bacterium]|nr:MAG: sulfotransferase family 2 domain-containing protein [Phycisphaerales bacterium]